MKFSLTAVEHGAAAYLECRGKSPLTLSGAKQAVLAEFMDAMDSIRENEIDLYVFSLLLTGEHSEAKYATCGYIEPEQSDDEIAERAFGEAADRGNDEREA